MSKDRLQLFTKVIYEGPTDPESFESFRILCSNGIPDELRGISWKILLNYLPFDKREDWPNILAKQRQLYQTYLIDHLKEPSSVSDHPLNPEPSSEWCQYFDDLKILEQIDKDVKRTLPGMIPHFLLLLKVRNQSSLMIKEFSFFQLSIPKNTSTSLNFQNRSFFKRLELLHSSKAPPTPLDIDSPTEILSRPSEDDQIHWEAIERILFIFAKLNQGVGYVQGMNELLCPIYYVLAHDPLVDSLENAEPDAFFLFNAIISVFKDHFLRSMDDIQPLVRRHPQTLNDLESDIKPLPSLDIIQKRYESGIGNSMKKVMKRLKQCDLVLWKDLKTKAIHPAYYLFRWISVLFTMEFTLPDVIQLWDTILASDASLELNKAIVDPENTKPRYEFINNFSCAMLICIRDKIIESDFGTIIQLLQNYPLENIDQLKLKATTLEAIETPNDAFSALRLKMGEISSNIFKPNEDSHNITIGTALKSMTPNTATTQKWFNSAGSALSSSIRGMSGMFKNSKSSNEEIKSNENLNSKDKERRASQLSIEKRDELVIQDNDSKGLDVLNDTENGEELEKMWLKEDDPPTPPNETNPQLWGVGDESDEDPNIKKSKEA